ncbi:beta-alanyl-dopamine/carcinine hydrolase-like [Penaeus indicus]|uniref:beta-alanyl-dopamine/carcinine hydrolase-like n=1 Tax=Penaeus indicus TaxID=29960 RepID=UPI00300C5ACC
MSRSSKFDRRAALPVLHTRGTHYEVGFDIGRTFRAIIEDYLAASKHSHDALLKQFSEGDGKIAYDVTLENLKTNFPQYIRELQGIADGARVPFQHLMVLHLVTSLRPGTHDLLTSATRPNLGCTSVSLNKDGEILLGHTEDAEAEMLNHLYIVEAEIIEEEAQGRWGFKREHFTALCYAGEVPGFCMGYNRHGIAFSVNVLRPRRIFSGKTPRHFLCRALLAADSMAAARRILQDAGVGAADGFSANVIHLTKDGGRAFHNFEVAPAKADGGESQVSVHVVERGQFFVHTNTYQHLDVEEHSGALVVTSSSSRLARAKVLPPPTTRELLVALLSDDEDPVHPIFRSQDPDFITTALGLFDVVKRKWTFWLQNPKAAPPLFSLPMTFDWDE